jgi:lipopolysaccharide biosynthesis protein
MNSTTRQLSRAAYRRGVGFSRRIWHNTRRIVLYRKLRRDYDLIVKSRLFDPAWYMAQNPDVETAGLDPLTHYVRYGALEGRDPHPAFDTAWYLAHNPDVAPARMNPLVHYIQNCESKGLQPHPSFEEDLYVSTNPDVIGVLRDGLFSTGLEHFVMNGRREVASRGFWRRLVLRSDNSLFDFEETAYLSDNPDVANLVSRGAFASGIDHFLSIGHHEVREGLRWLYSPDRFVTLIATKSGKSQLTNAKHACIFAHYDRDGIIDEHVVQYIIALHAQSVDLFFVTATDREAELSKIEPYIVKFFIKNEAGRDFGSWFIALKELGVNAFDKYEYLILANDSIYCPVASLKRMFSRMSEIHYNMWGVTDSKEFGAYHLQSYFLAFDSKARDALLPLYLQNYAARPYLTKYGQIAEYELQFAKLAADAGLSVGAYCSIADIREDVLRDPQLQQWRDSFQFGFESINPTHRLWDLLIRRYCCPGLKIELLRDNPLRVEGTKDWPQIITGGISQATIRRHLDRMKRIPSRASRLPGPVDQPASNGLRLRGQLEGEGFAAAKRLVLFAHYDRDGIVDDHVVAQIDALRRCDSSVVFITSAAENQLGRVRPLCASVLLKNDAGRDFGSWYLAAKAFAGQFKIYKQIILMNDSTYFPIHDPAEMFGVMDRRNLDFWGVIDSHLDRWHIISWFWCFGEKLIKDGWFDYYCSQYNDRYSKWDQVRNYEMQFPSRLRSQYKVGTYISVEDCRKYIRSLPGGMSSKYNLRPDASPMYDYWDILIGHFKCPALKIDTLLHNPEILDLRRVSQIIREETQYDFSMMRKHLDRMGRRDLPNSGTRWSAQKLEAILALDGGAFVTAIYRNILGRRPDPAGFAGFLKRVLNGEPKLDIVREVVASPEAANVGVIWNELSELLSQPAGEQLFDTGDTACQLPGRVNL